jgi:hypothetical protein
MKRSQAIALTALTTTLAAGFIAYIWTKRKDAKRKALVADLGYEMAYDVHYPLKYSRRSTKNDQGPTKYDPRSTGYKGGESDYRGAAGYEGGAATI